MSAFITSEELQRLISDETTPDEVLAQYLRPAPDRRLPLVPMLEVDTSKIRGPVNRGIFGVDLKSLNDRTNRKRRAAYEKRIAQGWTGLRLLAEGDSWFLYPVLLRDVVDNLSSDFAVYSVATAGDTLENMVRGSGRLEQLIAEHQFHALLLSAGGNDMAGDALASNIKMQPAVGRQAASYISDAFDTFVETTHARLHKLISRLLDRFPQLRIFIHGYDWPLLIKGPWLEPAMIARQVPVKERAGILKVMIDRHYESLEKLRANLGQRVLVVDCRGSVGEIGQWFDELHPRNPGFERAAARFRRCIDELFGLSFQPRSPRMIYRIGWRFLDEKSGARRQTREVPLGAEVTIGRSADREIMLDDQRVSRNHARIEITEQGAVVQDLNSGNGVFIDGRRITREVWKPGQTLKIMPYAFDISLAPDERAIDQPLAVAVNGKSGANQRSAVAEPAGTSRRLLEVEVCIGDIASVKSPAYVVGLFHHVSPVAARGAAMAIDEAVGGHVSALVQGGRIAADVGQTEVLTAPEGARLSGKILLTGLGPFGEFGPQTLEKVGEEIARALAAEGIEQAVTVPLGGSVGIEVTDFVQRFLAGFMLGLQRNDAGARFRRLTICEMGQERAAAIERALQDSNKVGASSYDTRGYLIATKPLVKLPSPVREGELSAAKLSASPPCWLLVQSNSEGGFAYTILLPFPKAGAPKFVHNLTVAAGRQLAAAIANPKLLDEAAGLNLTKLLLPEQLQAMLVEATCQPTVYLVVVHDEVSSTIPWEALYFGQHCPALSSGVSRIFELASSRSEATLLRKKRGEPLRMLLIENPTQNLAGATLEGRALTELFAASQGEVRIVRGAEATRKRVISELGTGTYDIVHFAGHARFMDGQATASGIVLADGTLAAGDLRGLDKVPQFIFLNACKSARVGGVERLQAHPAASQVVLSSPSLAAGLIASGVKTFIGTRWLVNDAVAAHFAQVLYGDLLTGRSVGLAISKARQSVVPLHPRDWANYLHFGDPTYTLREF